MALLNIVITAIASVALGAALTEHARVNRLEIKVDNVQRKQMMADAQQMAIRESRHVR